MSAVLVSLLCLTFATTSIIIMSVYRQHNSSDQLRQLKNAFVKEHNEITGVQGEIDSSLAGSTLLISKNNTFNTCIGTENARCSNLTTVRLEYDGNLTENYSVNMLNTSYQNVLLTCTQQATILKTQIAMVTPNSNPPILVQSGTFVVGIVNNTNMTGNYNFYKLELGDNLDIYYLVFLQDGTWNLTFTGTLNPTLFMTDFNPPIDSCYESLGIFPLIFKQQESFNLNPFFNQFERFCTNTFMFYSNSGNGTDTGVVYLLKDLMLIF